MPRLVDDAFGRIRHVLLTIPDFAVAEFGPALRSVVGALPKDAAIDILAGPAHRATVRDWVVDRDRVRIHRAPDGLDFSHWARDALVGIYGPHGNGNGPSLLMSDRFDRHDDAGAAEALASAACLPLDRTAAPYDGGNVLAMGDVLLIGADLGEAGEVGGLDATRRVVPLGTAVPRQPEATVASELLPDGWREVLRAGVPHGAHQPLFHLDLFVAPAGTGADGRARWMVGCPRLGAEVLGIAQVDHADAMLFDEIAERLRATGARVVRTPQPLVWTDRPDQKLRTWFHLPVANALVQIDGSSAEVWLPCFASEVWPELARVDAANKTLWEELGFTVHDVAGCLPLAERRGALRCMCNVIARDDAG